MKTLEELEVLFPERELAIGERKITVREFSFLEGLKAGVLASDLLDDLSGIVEPENVVNTGELLNAFGRHADVLVELIAMATGEDREFIAGLNREDGENLLMTFWKANADFFGNRLAMRWIKERPPDAPLD